MDQYDPRKNVLQGILKGAKHAKANQLKKKYFGATPNLEAKAKQPVPGADIGEEQAEQHPAGDDLASMLEQMVNGTDEEKKKHLK